ncbi:hypothetical protein ALC62_09835, partial [Cyphomyrmex costatus]
LAFLAERTERAMKYDSAILRRQPPRVEGRKERRTIERGPAQSTLTPLTENSRQTSGRLDETAERHETEGKRKWQSLSEGASTTLRSSKPLARKWYRGRVHHQ